jgi:predicted PurR-regulated permease PerM
LPFVVVFLGVLGGVIAFGVIGAFLGPVLLAVTYHLILEWTSDADQKP